jgi:hypothetical protein
MIGPGAGLGFLARMGLASELLSAACAPSAREAGGEHCGKTADGGDNAQDLHLNLHVA